MKKTDELSVASDIEYVPDSEESEDEADSTELPKFINFINQEIKTRQNQEEHRQLLEQKIQSKPSQRKLKESEIDRDYKYKDIYVKKYLKSNKGRTGLKKITGHTILSMPVYFVGMYSLIFKNILKGNIVTKEK